MLKLSHNIQDSRFRDEVQQLARVVWGTPPVAQHQQDQGGEHGLQEAQQHPCPTAHQRQVCGECPHVQIPGGPHLWGPQMDSQQQYGPQEIWAGGEAAGLFLPLNHPVCWLSPSQCGFLAAQQQTQRDCRGRLGQLKSQLAAPWPPWTPSPRSSPIHPATLGEEIQKPEKQDKPPEKLLLPVGY